MPAIAVVSIYKDIKKRIYKKPTHIPMCGTDGGVGSDSFVVGERAATTCCGCPT